MKVTQAVSTFLKNQRQYPLLQWYQQYGPALETQVNVSSGAGRPVPGKKATFTDGVNDWWSIRIPKKAMTDPEFTDYELRWPLELHAEAIGTTGWHWQDRRSVGFGFDFDAIAGHAKNERNATPEQLAQIQEAAIKLPYISAFRSSGGGGLHLWILLNGELKTANHDEHAAVARCLLGKMSADAGFNFSSHLDVCGGNMWIWHRKANEENRGYELLKQGKPLDVAQVPATWTDHIAVIKGSQKKVNLPGVGEGEMDIYEQLSNVHRIVPLDDQHHQHINELANLGFTSNWVQDHHLLQTHTVGLRQIHKKLGLKGIYETNSAGNNPGEANCFLYPRENGAWRVYRFGRGIAEHPCWTQDGTGYTACEFNSDPSIDTAARTFGSRPSSAKDGTHSFDRAEDAGKALKAVGIDVPLNESLNERAAVLKKNKDGQYVLEVAKTADDRGANAPEGWEDQKRKGWSFTFDPPAAPMAEEAPDYDKLVRALDGLGGDHIGWAVWQPTNKRWGGCGAGGVKTIFQSMGMDKPEAEVLMGQCQRNPWQIVSIPFEEEYPGGRRWNRRSIQLAERPASRDDDSTHPTYDLILDHIGYDLNRYLPKDEWAVRSGILSGRQYLTGWMASLIRYPFRHTPYLFVFGYQNCGKSILHELFGLLVTSGGVIQADRAITNQSDFTGELEHAILCVIEEKNLAKSPGAVAKIKALVTGETISLRKMREDSRDIPNKTHWVHVANDKNFCSIESDNTRIVAIHVRTFKEAGVSEIGKDELLHRLRLERPAFLRTLMDFPLPDPYGRLGLKVIKTHHTMQAEELNRSVLDQFVRDHCHYVRGATIPFNEFCTKFNAVVTSEDRFHWSKERISRSLPPEYFYGLWNGSRAVGNMSWTPAEHGNELICKDGKLVYVNS